MPNGFVHLVGSTTVRVVPRDASPSLNAAFPFLCAGRFGATGGLGSCAQYVTEFCLSRTRRFTCVQPEQPEPNRLLLHSRRCPTGSSASSTSHSGRLPSLFPILSPSCSSMPCVFGRAGQFQDAQGQTSCKNCPTGQFQDAQGQAGCKSCVPLLARIRAQPLWGARLVIFAPHLNDRSGAQVSCGCVPSSFPPSFLPCSRLVNSPHPLLTLADSHAVAPLPPRRLRAHPETRPPIPLPCFVRQVDTRTARVKRRAPRVLPGGS